MVLYTVAANSPPKFEPADKQKIMRHLMSIAEVLPCRYCRENFPQNALDAGLEDPMTWDGREGYFQFIYKLHNAVKVATTGAPLDFSAQEARAFLEECRAGCSSTPSSESSETEEGEGGAVAEKGCTQLKGKPKMHCQLMFKRFES